MTFDEAFARVVDHEGGFSDTRADRGNWTSGKVGEGELKGTKYGIAAHAYPDLDIAHLSIADARAIYRRDYWEPLRCDEMPAAVRFELFDLGVNSGIGAAARLLQKAAGVKADGVIGPVTMAAIAGLDPIVLARKLAGHRLMLMTELHGWVTFGRGWARRVAANLIDGAA